MDLKGCHLCRPQNLEPRAAMVVDIMTEGLVSDFHGIFDVALHAVSSKEEEPEICPARLQFHVQQVIIFGPILIYYLSSTLER